MKRICFLISFVSWLLTGAVAFSQNSLGLAYSLARVKVESEQIVQRALLKDPVHLEVVKKYMGVKAAFDPILTQLKADLLVRNSLRAYKNLDGIVKGSKDFGSLSTKGRRVVQPYLKALKSADSLFVIFYSAEAAAFEPGDIISGATLLYDVLKDIRDTRTKQVESVVALLESLRLSPVDGINVKDPVRRVPAKN